MGKPKLNQAGQRFLCIKNDIFDYIKDYQTTFERDPLAKLQRKTHTYYNDYWQCMDNLKEI